MDYKECKLIKRSDSEKNITKVYWIPFHIAKKGKKITITFDGANPIHWEIKKVYPNRLSKEYIKGEIINEDWINIS